MAPNIHHPFPDEFRDYNRIRCAILGCGMVRVMYI
jgi:hypothetical protein